MWNYKLNQTLIKCRGRLLGKTLAEYAPTSNAEEEAKDFINQSHFTSRRAKPYFYRTEFKNNV